MTRHFIFRCLICLMALCFPAAASQAHNYNNGYSYVTIQEQDHSVEYELLLPFPILLQYDTDGNELISDEELKMNKAAIEAYLYKHLELFNNEIAMDAELVSLGTAIQKQTEDTVVRAELKYSSSMPIGSLTILYKLIFDDIDSGHQNYIQLFQGDRQLIGHWVAEKGTGAIRYMPDGGQPFTASLLGAYMAVGAQHTVRSLFSWFVLLSLTLAAGTFKEGSASVAQASLYSLIGLVGMDKLSSGMGSLWLSLCGLIAPGLVVLCIVLTRWRAKTKLAAGLIGLAWGIASAPMIGSLQLGSQFKLVSLVLYTAGGLAAWLAMMYVLHVVKQLVPLQEAGHWSRRIGLLRKPLFVLACVSAWLQI